ncbi:MAG: AAA family ATPase [Sumerlaeia bacterium]
MYLDHFGFDEEPFTITPNPRFLYLSQRHKEALAALLYGIEQRKGFIALTGEIGSGKTTICRQLLRQLDRETIKLALILNPQLDDVELLQAINAEYGIEHASASRRELLGALNAFLLEQYAAGHNAVLVIDESQRLSPAALEQVRLISNLETEDTKLIQIALVGQPELDDVLHLPELEQLNQRIMVRCHIDPLDFGEVDEYIAHRVAVANPDRRPKFHKKALKAIYAHSGGVPRKINVVCDRALLIAFSRDTLEVSEAIAKKAVEEVAGRRRHAPKAAAAAQALASQSAVDVPVMAAAVADSQPAAAPSERRGGSGGWMAAAMLLGFGLVALAIYAGGGGLGAKDSEPLANDLGSLGAPAVQPPPGAVMELAQATATPTPTPAPEPTATATPEPTATPISTPEPAPEPQLPAAIAEAAPSIDDATTEALAQAVPDDESATAPLAAASLAEPSPTPAATPAAPTDWVYRDGILRVEKPAGAFAASVLTWLARHGYRLTEEQLAGMRTMNSPPMQLAGEPPLFLRQARLPAVLDFVEQRHLPLLVQADMDASGFGPWAVLEELEGGEAVLADPRHGRVRVPREELEAHLAGLSGLFRDLEGLADLRPGDMGPDVEALQDRLSSLGYLQSTPSGEYDAATADAVRAVRRAIGLPEEESTNAELAFALLNTAKEQGGQP